MISADVKAARRGDIGAVEAAAVVSAAAAAAPVVAESDSVATDSPVGVADVAELLGRAAGSEIRVVARPSRLSAKAWFLSATELQARLQLFWCLVRLLWQV